MYLAILVTFHIQASIIKGTLSEAFRSLARSPSGIAEHAGPNTHNSGEVYNWQT
jgi:hypothetical protein